MASTQDTTKPTSVHMPREDEANDGHEEVNPTKASESQLTAGSQEGNQPSNGEEDNETTDREEGAHAVGVDKAAEDVAETNLAGESDKKDESNKESEKEEEDCDSKEDSSKKSSPSKTRPTRKAAAQSSHTKPSPTKTPAPTKRKRGPVTKNTKEEKKPPKKTKTIDPSEPKVDGRSKNRGAAKRESYSVAFKAKMVRDFDAWEAEQKKQGNENPSVREFVMAKNLGHKFESFLSKANGWRSPRVRQRILQDSAVADYQHMARMPDRTKNKSYYADMEEALVERLEECRAKNLTVTTKLIRELARQELRRLTNNDEEKVNAFKASNGWVYNFLKRQERKAKNESMKQKREKATQKKQKEGGVEVSDDHDNNNNNNNENNLDEETPDSLDGMEDLEEPTTDVERGGGTNSQEETLTPVGTEDGGDMGDTFTEI